MIWNSPMEKNNNNNKGKRKRETGRRKRKSKRRSLNIVNEGKASTAGFGKFLHLKC